VAVPMTMLLAAEQAHWLHQMEVPLGARDCHVK
jgi:hypothetical protein